MSSVKSFILAGVGGQGIVLASNVFCSAVLNDGYDVKKSEIHGMAQRGGSVVSHVRYGKKVNSAVIPINGADCIISFEYMEYLRYLEYITESTVLVVNSNRILPPAVNIGDMTYPTDAITSEKSRFKDVFELDAYKLALSAGNVRAAGIVMLGKLSNLLEISQDAWISALEENLPKKLLDVNIKAFNLGVNFK